MIQIVEIFSYLYAKEYMNIQMYKCTRLGYLEQSIFTGALCYIDLSPISMSEYYKQEESNGQQR